MSDYLAVIEREEWGFAFMDEEPVPERPSLTRADLLNAIRPVVPIPEAPKRGRGSRMSKAEALASLAEYRRKYPGQTHIRKAYAALGDDTTLSRFVKTGEPTPKRRKTRNRTLPGFGHPKIEAGRSLFSERGVKSVDQVGNLLVSGHANVKIGRDVRKGKLFRGYWIYTLTLEERATCPTSCKHWTTCYGNNMPYAKRIEHGKALMRGLEFEVARLLAVRDRVGILIRLHALGDFWSVEYVAFLGCYAADAPAPRGLRLHGTPARRSHRPGDSHSEGDPRQPLCNPLERRGRDRGLHRLAFTRC